MCYNENEVIGMIVVFGGAFNPVTNAHIEVYHYINKKMNPKRFLFLPVSSAYTKSDLASNYHRISMLKLATKEFDNVEVSELEISDSDFLGTYQSLIRISDRYQDQVAFVIGADNIKGMENWINIEGILSEFTIIVLNRDNQNIDKLIQQNKLLQRFQSSFIIYNSFEMNMSSTLFRETMNENYVPKKVYQYIIDNELYRGDQDV
jgi:nicotinate-nucleotide adenylyltransferase